MHKVHKERIQEGSEFADKEEFVTGAYKRKLIELQDRVANEKKQAALEGLSYGAGTNLYGVDANLGYG